MLCLNSDTTRHCALLNRTSFLSTSPITPLTIDRNWRQAKQPWCALTFVTPLKFPIHCHMSLHASFHLISPTPTSLQCRVSCRNRRPTVSTPENTADILNVHLFGILETETYVHSFSIWYFHFVVSTPKV